MKLTYIVEQTIGTPLTAMLSNSKSNLTF